MACFGWFGGPYYPNYGLNLLKFSPEIVILQKKTCLNNLSKFLILNHTGQTQSLLFWSNFDLPPLHHPTPGSPEHA